MSCLLLRPSVYTRYQCKLGVHFFFSLVDTNTKRMEFSNYILLVSTDRGNILDFQEEKYITNCNYVVNREYEESDKSTKIVEQVEKY